MTKLSREELIELGLSIPTRRLIEWSRELITLTAGKEARLRHRGVDSPFLAEIATFIDTIQKSGGNAESEKGIVDAGSIDRARKEAISFWDEVKQIAKVEFGTQPDLLARFRTGVRTGPTLSRIAREIEIHLALLREHASEVRWLGADQEFLKKGEAVLSRLREAQARIDRACTELPPAMLELCQNKGRLYDLSRKLVRIGRLEFMREPEEAAAFRYDTIRQDRPIYSPARTKPEKASAR